MTKINFQFFLSLALAACTGTPNTVEVALAPSLISSLDGRTTVSAIVAEDATPIPDTAVQLTVDYTDRNGTPHVIAPIDGRTDERGVFAATLEGLQWDGTGKVTVTVDALAGEADFAVLDRTPPKVELLSPTTDNHVGPGLPIDVQVHVADEIGVGQVILDVTDNVQGNGNINRSTTLVSGTLDGTVTFRINVPQGAQAGETLVLYALATDLSGNSAAAMALTLTVDPTITIATPPGLMGSLLADGTATLLNDPRSIASSPKDGKLYVADVAGGACANHCIWQVDPATGTVNPTPVFAGLANVVGLGVIEGIAFDATGDNLYFTDRQDRTGRLTFNGTAYASPVLCNDPQTQRPQDPVHIVFDPTLGLLTPDGNGRELVQISTCAPGTAGVDFTNNQNFDQPHGIALGPTGEIYVSDQAANQLVRVDRANGAVTGFDAQIESPRGIEWFAGGTTPFADSLMVASARGGGGGGGGVIESTKGLGTKLAAAFLRNTATDLAFIGGTMFVLTSPSANNRGRIYKVSGF
ncbi:MAG: SMP-30/Gluconolactonase/LRE-like region [Deltaproteobacteria bacterium]|nr:SMP-30/Gluconolactonase/LRE-like region [Deltaproteobacteria bacterium]